MRKVLFLVVGLVLFVGAGCTPNQAYVKATKGYHDALLPEYEKYVINREPVPEWTDEEKKIRQDTVDGIRRLDKEAEDDE